MDTNTTLMTEDTAIIQNHISDGIARDLRTADSADYRVMLEREEDHYKFAGCYERPGQWVTRMEEYRK